MHKLCLVKNNALKKIIVKVFLITLITLPTTTPLHSFGITAALADIFCGLSIFKGIEAYRYNCYVKYTRTTKNNTDEILDKFLKDSGISKFNDELIIIAGTLQDSWGRISHSRGKSLEIRRKETIEPFLKSIENIKNIIEDISSSKDIKIKYYTNERNKSLMYAGILGISALGLYYLQKKS